MKKALSSVLAALSLCAIAVGPADAQRGQDAATILVDAPDSAWIDIAPENLLVMDLPSGRVLIELSPDLAPQHGARIRTLSRQGFYDGLLFHRVIDNFMAQGGDPTATGTGGSPLPDIPGEFVRNAARFTGFDVVGRDDRAAQVGFVGTVPIATQPPTLAKFLRQEGFALWGVHCPGVMSMARANSPDSANSQFFVMLGDSRDNLDRQYTVWGNVVSGYEHVRRIHRGEPPARPTPIVQMRLMSDMPAEQRRKVRYFDPANPLFGDYLRARGLMNTAGFIDDFCTVDVPVRIEEENA